MKKNFIFVYEDPEYIDRMEELDIVTEVSEELPTPDEDLDRTAYFYQQRVKNTDVLKDEYSPFETINS